MFRGLFKQQIKRKALMVDDGNYTAVKFFADKKGLNIQDTTSKLLYAGLKRSLGLDLAQFQKAEAILSVFQGIEVDNNFAKMGITVRLILPKAKEKHLIVSPILHLAVTEFARVKGLTIHEATYFLLRYGILVEEGIGAQDENKYEDPIGNVYQKINGITM